MRALSILEKTVKFSGQKYEVGLLWKYDHINAPDNRQLALRRHRCLEKKMSSEPDLRQIINNLIQDYLRKGYASKVPEDEINLTSWYLPIFVVRNPNKPNKIRLVWDAAAEMHEVSLNKMLIKGPDLLTSLPGVLLRFREHRVAVTGDIREMFHQITVKSEDRRFQRFMWRTSTESVIEVFEMNVMTFGASCSPCSSQYIKNLNAEKFRGQYQEAVTAIQRDHYVDDWLGSVDSTDHAIKLAEEVRYIHEQGGFEIRNWISNSSSVAQHLNNSSSAKVKNLEVGPNASAEKILGMFWRTSGDVFTYVLKVKDSNADIFNGENIPTKREILRILMSIFDPLGLISNILVYPKILLQKIWRSKINWDQEINEDHHQKWMLWSKELKELEVLEIPRWVGLNSEGTSFEMHCFVDASEDAFGAVIYFKVPLETTPKCSLVTAKSRVAPLQSLSVPRLELQAAVLGTRLAKFVQENISEQHKIIRRYFWSDSETVMKWLHSDNKKYTQFVSCRIGEILENSNVHEWNWLSGSQNVADMATKMKMYSSYNSREWFYGPSFLHGGSYPSQKLDSNDSHEELRPQYQVHHINHQDEAEYRIEKWTKLRRTYAFVIRFIKNLQLVKNNLAPMTGPLSCEEYVESERFLLKKAQIEGYAEEYAELKKGKDIRNRRSPIFKDSPFIDEFGIKIEK